jgi:hypothetical protein
MKNFVYLDCDNLDNISNKIDKFLTDRNLVTQHLNKIPHELRMRKYLKDPRVILSIYFTTNPTHLLAI